MIGLQVQSYQAIISMTLVCFSFKLHNEDDPPESSVAEQPSTSTETTQTPQTAALSEADTSPPPYCSIGVEAAATSGIFLTYNSLSERRVYESALDQPGTCCSIFSAHAIAARSEAFMHSPLLNLFRRSMLLNYADCSKLLD